VDRDQAIRMARMIQLMSMPTSKPINLKSLKRLPNIVCCLLVAEKPDLSDIGVDRRKYPLSGLPRVLCGFAINPVTIIDIFVPGLHDTLEYRDVFFNFEAVCTP
jgi:hypothetical protein